MEGLREERFGGSWKRAKKDSEGSGGGELRRLGGDGSEKESMTIKNEKKNRRPVSVPTSPGLQ